ncbi:hypothetical protein [Mesorhizobium sp. M0618]
MFELDAKSMKRAALASNLNKVATLFDVEIGYFARSATHKTGFSQDILNA